MRLRKETSKRPVEQVGHEPPPEFANLTVGLLQPVQHSKRYAITNVDSLGVIERFTFAEITRETARWAQLLRENGLQPGDRVLIVAGREWGWRCALLGAIHAGAVAVPCPPSLPLREIRTVAEHADASLLVSLRPPPEPVELDGRSALTADDLEEVDPAHALEQRPHRTDPRDIALILYAWHGLDLTGTMHTHASLLAQADTAEHWLGVDQDERIWATADDGSGPSIWLLLAAWRRAASIVVVDLELDSDAKLELLDRLRPAALWFSDDEYAILGSAAVPPWVDLRSIRRALVDSDETEGASSFATAFGAALVPVFALDELGVMAGWPAGREGHADAHTAQPAPGVQVAVVGEDGAELPPGEVGDVAVRGDAPTLFTGYAGKEGRSRSAGWFRFGWRGALTAEGALRLETRSPREVEPVEATADLPVPEVVEEPRPAEPVAADPEPAVEEDLAREKAEREAAEAEARQAAEAEAREAEQRQREVAAARAAADSLLLAKQEEKERAAAEAEERRRAEEQAKAQQEVAAAEAKERAKDEKRREEERQKDARARAEQEAKEREKAEAEERRRAEEDAKSQAKLAAAEAKQRAEDEKRREKEREREEKEARARGEQEAKEREKAEAEERRRAEEDAKIQAKLAAAEAKQRAKDDKEREKREAEAAKVQAKVDAAEAKQRAADDKEREKREAKERVEREKAEAEAAKVQAKVDAAEAKQRAEEEKRREKEREREEKEARSRAEQEAKEAERAERRAAREEKRRRPEAPKPADDGQRRFGRRRREVVEEPEPEHVPDVVARIQQYGMSATSSERPAEPPDQPDDE